MRNSLFFRLPVMAAGMLIAAAACPYAADAPSPWPKDRPPFALSPRHGSVTEYDAGSAKGKGRLIVIMQDLHANVGVQKNIAAMLYRLNRWARDPQGLLVCVEGASGEGDVSLLRSLPGVLRHGFEAMLLRRAYLTGAELAATEAAADWSQAQNVVWFKIKSFFVSQESPAPVSLSPIRLWGVDDPDLYRKNWKAAKIVDKQRLPAMTEFKQTREFLKPGASAPLRKQLDLVSKALMLRLQPKEYKDYLKGRGLNPRGKSVYQSTLEAAEVYYEAADDRSTAMRKNILSKMGLSTRICVLVTGGFHTEQIARELKEEGIAYAVVTPRVEVLDQDAAYRARLREEE